MSTQRPEYSTAATWLGACRRPLLVSHRRPDGDALGSLAALALLLKQRGVAPAVALLEPFPARYRVLESFAPWRLWREERDTLVEHCDAVVILDTCAFAQLGPIGDWLNAAPRTLVIDHHATSDALATRPGDQRIIDPSASATCLLLTEFVRATGGALDDRLATALLVGLATDTGWFRFSNADARTLHAAAELVAAGAQPAEIYDDLYQRDSAARLRLVARLLQTLELEAGGRLAVLRLRQADFAATGADMSDTEDLVNEVNRLGCADATVMFTEEPDGVVRVNFRSKRRVDVAKLAQQFGGGGHVRAAGARVRGDWEATAAAVVKAAAAAVQQSA